MAEEEGGVGVVVVGEGGFEGGVTLVVAVLWGSTCGEEEGKNVAAVSIQAADFAEDGGAAVGVDGISRSTRGKEKSHGFGIVEAVGVVQNAALS